MLPYVVHQGDTLSGLAQSFGVSLSALEAANPRITDPNLIFSGQVILIPVNPPAPGTLRGPIRGHAERHCREIRCQPVGPGSGEPAGQRSQPDLARAGP